MAKIGDLISSVQVGKKRYSKPEWWSTTHKLKKQVKYEQYCRANSNLNSSYRVNSEHETKSFNAIISDYQGMLTSEKYKVFAPWNPIFRPFKTIIIFGKSKLNKT